MPCDACKPCMQRRSILVLLCAHAFMGKFWLTVLALHAVSRHELYHGMKQPTLRLAGT